MQDICNVLQFLVSIRLWLPILISVMYSVQVQGDDCTGNLASATAGSSESQMDVPLGVKFRETNFGGKDWLWELEFWDEANPRFRAEAKLMAGHLVTFNIKTIIKGTRSEVLFGKEVF